MVNAAEALTVRHIFNRYLELGSVHALRAELERQAIRSKAWVSTRGNPRGDAPFSRGALFYLLKNRIYLGEILHRKATAFVGAHPPIIDPEVFDAVQRRLQGQARTHRERPTRVSTMALKGRLFDVDGHPMCPVFTNGNGNRVYRYYVSAPLLQGVKDPLREGVRRTPAGPLEDLVRECLKRLSRGRVLDIPGEGVRVDVLEGSLRITTPFQMLLAHPSDPEADLATLKARLGPGEHIRGAEREGGVCFTVPCRFLTKGGRVWITDDKGKTSARSGSVDRTLINGLRLGHAFLCQTTNCALGRPEQAMLDMAPSDPYHRKLFRLAYLAPDIQAMILEGRQPETLNLQTLVTAAIPAAWAQQRRMFGIAD